MDPNTLTDLRIPLSNMLEKIKVERKGQYSINKIKSFR